MTISAVDLRVLVHEMKSDLEGAWITNIYQLPTGIFIFKLRVSQKGTRFLLVEPGKRIHFTQFNRVMPKEPSAFAKTLRTHIRDRRINTFEQVHMDRLVKMVIGADDGKMLVIELFGEGNIILVQNTSKKILGALRYRKMRDRDIHPGREFLLPPAPERNILYDDLSTLPEFLKKETKLFRAVNSWLSLGPEYSRVVLNNTGITKKKSSEITEEEIGKIIAEAERLKEILVEHDYSPEVILDEESVESASDEILDEEDDEKVEVEVENQWADDSLPFEPERVIKITPWHQYDIENTVVVKVDSLGLAHDVFYSSQEEQTMTSGETEVLETEADRLRRRLADQQEHKANMEKQAERLRKEGEALFLNYSEVDEVLTTIFGARKKKVPWETIIEKLMTAKEKGVKSAQIIEEILPNRGEVKVVLPYNGENIKLTLDIRKTVNDIADAKFTRAKKQEKRAKGAEIAINMTLDKIKEAEESVKEKRMEAEEQITLLNRRRRWYERWTWMEAEDGTIIIGGKDASSNENLVKKYLEDDDYFLHADINGAPFVVIKTGGKKLTEATKRVAGCLGVCFSSAWKGKRVTADAFILPPDQVSLSAPSGEYLPKGSIMMYGQKDIVKDIELILYIGVVLERSWARLICGPKETLGKASLLVGIKPGDVQRGKLAKMIKRKFIAMVEGADAQKIKAIDLNDFINFIPAESEIIEFIDNRKESN